MSKSNKSKGRPSRLSLFFGSQKLLLITSILIVVIAMSTTFIYPLVQTPAQSVYTTDEVMTAYENGQFRVIHTRNRNMAWSPDFNYVSVLQDGTYRASDGALLSDIYGNTAFVFSPDEQYLASRGNGIYRLPDFQQVVPARAEGILIANGEHRVTTGDITFSSNSDYVSITGAGWYREEALSQSTEGYGVFRLSDGAQIIESDSFNITFSPNGDYASVQEGIFRLSDGSQLFEGGCTIFSPNGEFVYRYPDGVYRLNDGVQIIATEDDNEFPCQSEAVFSPDSQYFLLSNEGVYEVASGQKLYAINYHWVYGHLSYFTDNNQYLIVPRNIYEPVGENMSYISEQQQWNVYNTLDGTLLFEFDNREYSLNPSQDIINIDNTLYRMSDQRVLFSVEDYWVNTFSPQGSYISAGNDGIYRVADGVFILSLDGINGWGTVYSPDEQYVTIGSRGVFDLNTQEHLFDIDDYMTAFTPDGQYLFNSITPVIYRMRDGHEYNHVHLIDVARGILQVGNTILIIDETQESNSLEFVEFSYWGNLAILGENETRYLVGFNGELQWINKEDAETTFSIP